MCHININSNKKHLFFRKEQVNVRESQKNGCENNYQIHTENT